MKNLLKVTAIALTLVAGASAAQAGNTITFDGYSGWVKDAMSPRG